MRIPLVLWLSFFLYYWVCLNFHVSVVSGLCLDDQKSLLLQLKKDLIFNSAYSSKLVSWNESLHCNQWSGVTWDEEGHVTDLDLSEESISGGFDDSSSLFSLQYVENLNLAHNNFNSVIPSRIENLKNLTSLNLSRAGFMGQIPVEISQLTRLAILDLTSYGDLKLEKPNLVMLIQNLTEVRELYLDGVSISLKGKEWSRALSSYLPHLEVLSMSDCNLSGPVDFSLEKLKNLSIICLDSNNFAAPMPEFFANFSNLTHLSLSFCDLNGWFPKKIFQVHSLTSLDLSWNFDLRGSLPHFLQNGSLQTLKLFGTKFSGALPYSISNLRQLSEISIKGCQFNGTLPDSMSNLTELTYLDLSSNDFKGPIPSFGTAKKLTHIDISNNRLSGEIPLSLFSLPLLETINLSNNHFQGQLSGISNVSSSMLQTLDLSGNHLGGPIPQFIFHLQWLETLQLSSNEFNGTIQLDMIWRLQNLFTLGLSNNDLSVDANVKDAHLLSFPMMTTVSLTSCKLRQFPAFLRNLPELVKLDLSNNQIVGKIPNWIWELPRLAELNLSHNSLHEVERPSHNFSTSLNVLDLHDNNLQGTLPIFISANIMDYSFNNFSSDIPPDMLSINFLSLSHNAFHGRIPDSLCNASYLEVLDLSSNNFNGMIPHCLAKTENLRVLDLGKNNLSGNLPNGFQDSCGLLTLDLHGNNLQGPLPKSLSSCTELEVLDLGNNRIEDQFPCFLEKLSDIQVLILRKNYFYGPIGCPRRNKVWEVLQILDLAFNNFKGTLPGESFRTWKALMLDEFQTTSELNDLHFEFNATITYCTALRNRPCDYVLSERNPVGKYYDQVIVTNKGQEMSLSKILTIHTFIDFSSNHFEGPIPEEMMEFRALHGLNLSNNHLSGHIPSSIWKMKQLESLDLSNNSFIGEIPSQLASLSFLEFLNLSSNHLFGEIPTGTQIQSFPASSFAGNKGLCGPPLTKNCSADRRAPTEVVNEKYLGIEFDWHFVLSGAVFGLGIIIGPLLYWKKWRIRYWRVVDNILCSIFPQLYHEYQWHQGQAYEVLRWRR